MADPSDSASVAHVSTLSDTSTTGPNFDIPETHRPLITDTVVSWQQPQILPGERDRGHLDPTSATTQAGSSGQGSTIHDLGQSEFLDEVHPRSSPPVPFHTRSPSESRRSTAELVARAGTWESSAGANNTTRANTPLADSDAAFYAHPEEPPLEFENEIRAAFIESASKERKLFLPNDAFRRIVTRDRVRQELARLTPNPIAKDRLEWLTNQVWEITPPPNSRSRKRTTRRKIFAILALIDRVQDIVSFIDEGIHDSDLPFLISDGPKRGTRQLNRRDRHGKMQPISSVLSWKAHVLESFNGHQWQLLAPYFTLSTKQTPDVKHFFFDKGIILPFTLDDEITPSEGGYGDVWKVKIHPAHHNCTHDSASDDDNPPYAVKRLRNRDPEAFKDEVSNLKRFSSRDHLHLIKLLVTFEWCDQYYLLFPFADGNLLHFWKLYPRVADLPRDRKLALWFSRQCLGLAQGLKMIHTVEFKHGRTLDPRDQEKNHGRHGDLKPENILWFRTYHPHADEMDEGCAMGLLKISDFGLTRFHRSASVLSKLDKRTAVSPTYRAPEYDVARFVDQSYDIWTLGCVLLEFVTWYVLGWEEVEAFSINRSKEDNNVIHEDVFFNHVDIKPKDGGPVQIGARAKRSVANEFERLYQHENCSEFVFDLLGFIETKLMRMGPNKRANCEEIVKKLTELHDRCKTDSHYYTERAKSPPTRRRTDLSELLPSALPYSPEQQRRIRRENVPEVPQQDDMESIESRLALSSPFDLLQNRPPIPYTERVGNYVQGQQSRLEGGKRDQDVASDPLQPLPSSLPRCSPPIRDTLPSFTVTPSAPGPSQILVHSPTLGLENHITFTALDVQVGATNLVYPAAETASHGGSHSQRALGGQTSARNGPTTAPSTGDLTQSAAVHAQENPEPESTDHNVAVIQSPQPTSNSGTIRGSRHGRDDAGSALTEDTVVISYRTFNDASNGAGYRRELDDEDPKEGTGFFGWFCGAVLVFGLFIWRRDGYSRVDS